MSNTSSFLLTSEEHAGLPVRISPRASINASERRANFVPCLLVGNVVESCGFSENFGKPTQSSSKTARFEANCRSH